MARNSPAAPVCQQNGPLLTKPPAANPVTDDGQTLLGADKGRACDVHGRPIDPYYPGRPLVLAQPNLNGHSL